MNMKVVLELKNKPVKGDLLIIDDNETVECVSKNSFLKEEKKRLENLEQTVFSLSNEIELLKNDIKLLKGEDE